MTRAIAGRRRSCCARPAGPMRFGGLAGEDRTARADDRAQRTGRVASSRRAARSASAALPAFAGNTWCACHSTVRVLLSLREERVEVGIDVGKDEDEVPGLRVGQGGPNGRELGGGVVEVRDGEPGRGQRGGE